MARSIALVFTVLLFASQVFAQQDHPMQGMQMPMEENHQKMNMAADFLMNEAAGTGVNPSSSPMGMVMTKKGHWSFMAHGYAFLNSMQQTGPRGDDEGFSTNHVMLMAQRDINERSSIMIRSMLSLEPATITDRRYPELFQTGETAYGRAIVDGQHPHDFFMELSVQYALQLSRDLLVHFYVAPVGDPGLGPVAYPHRISAEELPQATLAHHLQDSTHISDDVLTAGIKYRYFRWEISGFHGAEPDEHRWDIDQGAVDSWSTRAWFVPSSNWVAQVSTGKLKKPEALELGSTRRTTASVTYNRMTRDGFWATSIIWGRNHKLATDRITNSYGVESLLQFRHLNYLTGRFEAVDKDELFADRPAMERLMQSRGFFKFRIKAFTLGYARDFMLIHGMQTGAGANFTVYSFPSVLEPFYGKDPKAFLIYFRIRSGRGHAHSEEMQHHGA